MKKRLFPVMLVSLLALSFLMGISCKSFQITGVEVSRQASSGSELGKFDINVKVSKFLGGAAGLNLFNVTSEATDPRIIDAIKAEISRLGGSKAINVKIEYQASFINILLNAITFSIYAPATAHVTGTVIR